MAFQLTDYGLAEEVPIKELLEKNSTLVTPILSEAFALIFTIPDTVEPLDGLVIFTVGLVVSLITKTVTTGETPTFKAASNALVNNLYVTDCDAEVFQLIE